MAAAWQRTASLSTFSYEINGFPRIAVYALDCLCADKRMPCPSFREDPSQRSTSNRAEIESLCVISRITRAGTPAAKVLAGMSLVTTLPAPMTQPRPMVTPGHTTTFAPNQQSLPMATGLA